ncbi:FtsH protease activity modulator HflK [Desulfonatronum lacustre]|uniref:FtsH protease activity modulator HflK n=1 Tax=Desulfonatronum lacustre TaxID=66849 RepID=UPI0004B7DAAA|nr:FtsH protease activity modulator HflK [Desulfonatronum lacustre]SMP63622.1 protease FtsH subunit HflK [Desulfonatronum zhilinae]
MNWDWDKLQDKRKRNGPPGAPDLAQLNEQLNKLKNIKLPGGGKIVVLVLLLLWLASGIYIVNPDEVGVVQRFGAYNRITDPGPHFRIPFPFESVQTPKVTQVRRFEIGYRTIQAPSAMGGEPQYRIVPEESHMLTGDENIVDVQFIVQYQLNDPVKFLFNIQMPDASVKSAAEAAMREVIGYNKLDAALTDGKPAIQDETRALMQNIMDRYESGIQILAVQLQDVQPPEPVIDSFRDVVRAREDAVRIQNQAEAYRNDIVPRARGEAAVIINQAEAHKEAVVRRAEGEAQRFLSMLAEYNQAPDVTRTRLYLETMEEVLSNPELMKTFISDNALSQVLPYLPLGAMTPGAQRLDAPEAASQQARQPAQAGTAPSVRGGRAQ